MGSAVDDARSGFNRELVELCKAILVAEERREARLRSKLAEIDTQLTEAARIQQLITGGAARREARLRALEDTVEAMAAERARTIVQPRPLDIPGRGRVDASVVDMRSAHPGSDSQED